MKKPRYCHSPLRQRQRGAAIVEFALIASIFFFMVLLLMEFGRLMFTWNSAVEATRRGARLAIVCDQNAAAVTSAVLSMLPPQIKTADISVTYPSSGGFVQAATVSISPNAASIQYYFPLTMGLIHLSNNSWNIPAFSTTLTTESLSNGSGSDANPDCS